MPLSLSTILMPPTAQEVKQTLANLLASAGFPVSSWQPYTVGRGLLESESTSLADLGKLIGQIAAGGLLDFATGAWLTLLAHNLFGLTRKTGLPTRGTLRLTDAGGSGPVGVAAGGLRAQSAGLYYRNVDGGTLTLSSTLDLTWQAEQIGAVYNASNGADFALVTTIPGVTLATQSAPGESWIVQQGLDVETDEALRIRCRARWATLGGGASIDAYTIWSMTASAEVAKVAVFAHTPAPGQVSIYLAGAAGPVSGTAVTDVEAYLTPARVPVCVEVIVASATPATLTIAGTASVASARYAAAKSAIQKALVLLIADLPLGGTLYSAQVVKAVMAADPGMIDFTLTGGDADTVLATNEVGVLGLTFADNPSAGLFALVKV